LICGLAAGLALAAAGWATSAGAENPDFCRGYADSAMHQVRAAYDSHTCGWAIDQNPARWTHDYNLHFNWCLGAHRRDADRENDARAAILDRCIHADWRNWRHDNDWSHDQWNR
jgi:hypothetical protein